LSELLLLLEQHQLLLCLRFVLVPNHALHLG